MHANTPLRTLLAICILAIACAPPPPPPVATPAGLFVVAAPETNRPSEWSLPVLPAAVIRQRLVTLNSDQIQNGTFSTATESVVLNLFDDVSFTAVRSAEATAAAATASGVAIWRGTIEGLDVGEINQVALASLNGLLVAEIFAGDRHFQVHPQGEGLHAVAEVDLDQYPPDESPEAIRYMDSQSQGESQLSADAGPVAQPNVTPNVSVLVVYNGPNPPGMQDAVTILANLAVSYMAQSFTAQGIDASFSIVNVSWVNYVSTGDSVQDLAWVMGNAGVQTLRTNNSADTVTLWDTGLAAGSCGIAGYAGELPTAASSAKAYTAVSKDCAVGNYSFAHEQGHLLGLQHDHYTLIQQGVPGGTFAGVPCSYGFANLGISRRTIMAYNNQCSDGGGNCRRVNVWSTPAALSGQPAGSWGVTCTPPANASAASVDQIGPGATVVSAFN